MTAHSIAISADSFRRFGTARRTLTLTPGVPSQDVSRYQAQDMPKPTYDLDRKRAHVSLFTILFRTYTLLHS